jgi:hypothetical protein
MLRVVTWPHRGPRTQQIRLGRDPTRRTWRRSDGPRGSDGGRVSSAPARPETRLPNRLTRGRKPRREKQRAEFALRGTSVIR